MRDEKATVRPMSKKRAEKERMTIIAFKWIIKNAIPVKGKAEK